MDRSGIEKLIKVIGVNYPQARKSFENSKGDGIAEAVIEEWHRQIGFLSYEDAIERLDAWMEGDDHKKAPMAVDFKLTKPRHKDDAFHAPISHIWRIERGRLFDEEDREYVVDPTVELPFYWDENGYACQGKIQYRHIRRGARNTHAENGKEKKMAEFKVIDVLTGVEADPYEIALKEPWAQHLMYCDMEGFAILEDGTLMLTDECGKYEFCPEGRFVVKWEVEQDG